MANAASEIPELFANDTRLGAALSNVACAAINNGLFEQEVDTGEEIRLRFGVRANAIGHEFFAENAETGEEVPLNEQQARKTRSGLSIKLNEFRKLRPSQPILKPGRRPDQEFDARSCKFGCIDANTPNSLLKRPVLLRISGCHLDLAVMPQLAPLEPVHVLLVPCASGEKLQFPHLDQLLGAPLIEDMVNMAAGAKEWSFLFNSMHAGATVRHLHLQALRTSDALPIESASTRTEQGWRFIDDSRFPGGGLVFEPRERAKLIRAVLSLQTQSLPLNLLASNDKTFLFPRHLEHEIADAFPFSGFASMEFAGTVYTSSKEAFEHATDANINAALAQTSLPVAEVLRILNASR